MFVKNKNYDRAIQKVRIEVGTLVGCEEDSEAYITLKELPTKDMIELRKQSQANDEGSFIEYMRTVLPHIIVDHNFYQTEQKKMSNEEVTEFIFEKLELTSKVLMEYINRSFRFSNGRPETADNEPSN